MEAAILISEVLVAASCWSCCLVQAYFVAAAAASQREFWTVPVGSAPQAAAAHRYCPTDFVVWEYPFETTVSWFATWMTEALAGVKMTILQPEPARNSEQEMKGPKHLRLTAGTL